MPTLTILNNSIPLSVPTGTNLLAALREAGLSTDAPCGGHGRCGKCRVTVDGEPRLACRTTVDRDMKIELPESSATFDSSALPEISVPADGKNEYVLAFDVGTTTLVGYLLSGKTGELLAHDDCLNPQTAYGADVISRVQYRIAHGLGPLRDCIRKAMSDMTRTLAARAGISPEDITCTAVAGNTAMHHLLLGIDPTLLTVPPYMPAQKDAISTHAPGWLPVSPGGELRVLPNIGGFVGADTAAGLLACGFDTREGLSLLLDIGTNGELVLGNREKRIACSTAAGPAFEGAGIYMGMRAEPGAITAVTVENGALRCTVRGGGEAKGLCGAGLLDAVACLLKLGVLDESGKLNPQAGDPACHTMADGCRAYRLTDTVVLTQKDVRQLQLAKGAIRAGLELLTKTYGISFGDISMLYLAGAFGNKLNPDSACAIGMLPEELRDKIIPVGNAAGRGACMAAACQKDFHRAALLSDKTAFLELASCPDFQDTFIDALEFT